MYSRLCSRLGWGQMMSREQTQYCTAGHGQAVSDLTSAVGWWVFGQLVSCSHQLTALVEMGTLLIWEECRHSGLMSKWPPPYRRFAIPPSVVQGNQCSVAEWLRRWANLGVITNTELLGGRGSYPTAGMGRLGFFIQGSSFNGFPWPKMFCIYSPPNKITSWPICSHVSLL